MSNKVIIGILPISSYMSNDDSFNDKYNYSNNYVKKIIEHNAIPYFIPLVNNEIIEDTLSICDGLLLPGGNKIINTNFKIIDYFYQNKLPMLGICLGMQQLAMYSMKLDNNDIRIIKEIDLTKHHSHWTKDVTRSNEQVLNHPISIKDNTILHNIFNKDTILVNSYHNYTITNIGTNFKISAISDDNLIEAIEYNKEDNFILGVQFHPEIIPDFDNIFKVFIESCQKRKNN